jgi:hypothetical protein
VKTGRVDKKGQEEYREGEQWIVVQEKEGERRG